MVRGVWSHWPRRAHFGTGQHMISDSCCTPIIADRDSSGCFQILGPPKESPSQRRPTVAADNVDGVEEAEEGKAKMRGRRRKDASTLSIRDCARFLGLESWPERIRWRELEMPGKVQDETERSFQLMAGFNYWEPSFTSIDVQ